MNKKLIIVESPTKAKTISRFLSKDYIVESSYGHVRDLPKSKLGIDVENNFQPSYLIPLKAKKVVTNLKKKISSKTEVYLATDEDREGEAIAWHLIEALKLPIEQTKRVAFHEITATAVKKALENPRELDLNMVDAQQARRILDRLVGYKLSPWLWQKVAKGLSAGRVQSVAVRLIVEREKEIQAFQAEEYWKITGKFNGAHGEIRAPLTHRNGQELKYNSLTKETEAIELKKELEKLSYEIGNLQSREQTKRQPSPLTTSLLQQEANRKHGFSSKQTMMLAQQLYEGVELGSGQAEGLITYMRTDSQFLSDKFINEARDYIKTTLGASYLPATAQHYRTKSKNAQEAHEAIRPANVELSPESIKNYLNSNQYKLYKLIWSRSVATQMMPAKINITTLTVNDTKQKFFFTIAGEVITFPGFLKIYQLPQQDKNLPPYQVNDPLTVEEIETEQHFTKAPARYSDAGLVNQLEKRGIGRPSTYAPTISTIIERNYVTREEKKLKPTEIGILVNDMLIQHFPNVVDYGFTAKMENELDEIARGEKKWEPIIADFYHPFAELLAQKYDQVEKKHTSEITEEICPSCQGKLAIKYARFGKFLACSNFPTCRFTKNINTDADAAKQATTTELCPECSKPLVDKRGRFGQFLACSGYPDCKFTKPLASQETNITCPRCQQGKIVGKKTKRNRMFYGCNRYPECDFALWHKPTGESCPKCQSLLLQAGKNIKCSNNECDYQKADQV
ncbi:MAG: type I DNA topoisomerase [Candidatus Komeilibacteria bacterium CG_4_10_14_0_2_um_filter_37_10]|uniref:DNA topoisomerase 1 n=1 Tax=Candidatus Komeilibacteria bacterium CG_4_10_14_0_2_um_filter_37_10 TaxID=1974470 RepID=A0A2M7VGV2_9BACT|nr:MAG: type I DNA topoisomerase [Candidatus Komeilibacteria bacterium CG_4_10_14_0_2_um_filter_37_10]